MKTIREYKELARQNMRGSYGQGVALYFGVGMAQSILSTIFTMMAGDSQIMNVAYAILSLIVATIIFNPLLTGLAKFFLEQAQGRPAMKNLFHPFNTNLTNVVKIGFFRDMKQLLWFVPAFIPAVAMVVFIEMGVAAEKLIAIPFVMLLFMIPGIIKSIEYSVINYILAENPDIKSKDAFKMANEMMTGNKGKLFLLEFSFIGWLLLGALAFGIGMYFVMPYMEAATAQFYLDVKSYAPVFCGEYDATKFDDGDTFGL